MLAEWHRDQVKREDRRAGEIVAILFNLNRDVAKDPNGIDWTDVFPEWKESAAPMTDEQMFENMMLHAKRTEALGANP